MDLEAMNNALLTFSIDEFTDTVGGTPFDFSGYAARGALLENIPGATPIPLTSVVITDNNVTGKLAKADVENLNTNTPYIYDLSVDNSGTGDSFVLWTGIIFFRKGASS